MLEPYEGKLSCTVLRGEGGSNTADLLDRPRDLEQRNGRIIRQGNENSEVEIYRYVTEGTFDAYSYQTVENKQRGISQVFTSKSPARVMQEIDTLTLSYAEVKALTTGNPLIIERCNLDTEVQKLKLLKSNYLNEKYELENKLLNHFPKEIVGLKEIISGLTDDIAQRDQHTPAIADTFAGMEIRGIVYTEKGNASKQLLEVCQTIHDSSPVLIGKYRGFPMAMFYEPFYKEYRLNLKGKILHTVSLGSDMYGNMNRIDYALSRLEERRSDSQKKLNNTEKQFEAAKQEVEKPFLREQELTEKTKRLEEITALLNSMDNLPINNDVEKQENSDRIIVALESTEDYSDADIGFTDYQYADGQIAHRYRLVCVGEDGKLDGYSGMPEAFFRNEYLAQKFLSERAEELTVIPYEEMLGLAKEHSVVQAIDAFKQQPAQDFDVEFV